MLHTTSLVLGHVASQPPTVRKYTRRLLQGQMGPRMNQAKATLAEVHETVCMPKTWIPLPAWHWRSIKSNHPCSSDGKSMLRAPMAWTWTVLMISGCRVLGLLVGTGCGDLDYEETVEVSNHQRPRYRPQVVAQTAM